MLRKKTQLETRLESKGFKLSHKTYKGNKSQFIEFYVYYGVINNYGVEFFLNPKRDNIEQYRIVNLFPMLISEEDIDQLNTICMEIYEIVYPKENDNESSN